jgi:hypothetical protein
MGETNAKVVLAEIRCEILGWIYLALDKSISCDEF